MKNFLKVSFLGTLLSAQVWSAAMTEDDAIPTAVVQGPLKAYTSEEVHLINEDLRNIRELSFRAKKPSDSPIYLSTAGGPGSMKSTILENYCMADDPLAGDNFVYADPDVRGLKFMINTYAQDMTPYALSKNPEGYAKVAYEKWRGASNYIAQTIINEAYAGGFNIAHGTTATAAAVANLYKNLKKEGYKIILLLCDTTDENRQASIRHREKAQGFYQVTPEDSGTKSAAFYDRFPGSFEYADELYFYWTEDFRKGSIQAARFNKMEGLKVLNTGAYNRFKDKYDNARRTKPLPPFEKLVTLDATSQE